MCSLQEFNKIQPPNTIVQLRELQVNRRFYMLEEQRKKRNEEFSYLRDLKRIVPHLDISRGALDDTHRKDLAKNLMISEWMMEEPIDLEDFILVPCPKGTRATLIFESSDTKKNQLAKVYGKAGHKLLDIRTNIPLDTMIDCIYVKRNNTIYILDCMKYNGRDMTNCDLAFRRYWIGSKFYESRLGVVDAQLPQNNMKLSFIEGYDFEQPHRVHHCFQHVPCFEDLGAELDGFLFYHKDASYTPGETPLVLWLFPYMIDEVLTMFRVNPDYNSMKPDGYVSYLEQIEKFNSKKKGKDEKKLNSWKKKVEEGKVAVAGSRSSNETSFEDERQPGGSRSRQNSNWGGQSGYRQRNNNCSNKFYNDEF